MIRFMPDTWRDALLRPLAMTAPNGSVYIELIAPDFRFVFALGLAALVAIGMHKRTNAVRVYVWLLFWLTFLSFVPWLATSGNGRYFMPYLILIGPLCIGLINMLTFSGGMKIALVLMVLGLQGFALYQNNPWKPFDNWGVVPWQSPPYYSIDIDPQTIELDATYITMTAPTMSLLAPKFPPESRWVNLSIFNDSDIDANAESISYKPVQRILQTSKSIKLFQRSSPNAMLADSDQPNQFVIDKINADLAPHRLALKLPTECKLFASKSPKSLLEFRLETEKNKRDAETPGFWSCSLQYPISAVPKVELTVLQIRAAKVFKKLETLCPKFFPPEQTLVKNHLAEHSRAYPGSDSFLILKHSGDGQADEVLSDRFRIDCTKFKGRAGLPWEREI